MHIEKKYQGIVVPVVTPLTNDFYLDHDAVAKIFENTAYGGCMPFILGTTGEAASLPLSIKQEYIRTAVATKKPDKILYAGIGSNCLQESIDLATYCFEAGVDVVVATLPSYYMLNGEQIKSYFLQLADNAGGPLIIYNIPATTHHSIPLEIIDELSHHKNIVGVKDSERSEERMHASIKLWAARKDFSYFLGWAAKAVQAILAGADGIVPSSANLYDHVYWNMWAWGKAGKDINDTQAMSDKIGELYQGKRSLGDSLAALKMLMHHRGLCQPWMMPPLQRLSPEDEKALIKDFEEHLV